MKITIKKLNSEQIITLLKTREELTKKIIAKRVVPLLDAREFYEAR